jgi:hypothetical protein
MELVVEAFGDEKFLFRPCVDCGLMTGNYCETMRQLGHELWQGGVCLAEDRIPNEKWASGQSTPLCSLCERKHGACHFCRQEDKELPKQKSVTKTAENKALRLEAMQGHSGFENATARVSQQSENIARFQIEVDAAFDSNERNHKDQKIA